MPDIRPLVSVIVPVYRDEERLAHCLDALAGQSYPTEQTEVIVVDNGCDGLEAIVARHTGVTVVEERTPGSYAARNRGIQHASGAILAFTDADCRPAADWLAAGATALERLPRLAVVGGRIEMTAPRLPRRSAFDLYDLVCGLPQKEFVERLGFAATANLFARRELFEEVGLFTPDLKSSGDREWALRVTEHGHPIAYADDVVVQHRTRHTLGDFVRRRRRITGGWWQMRRLLASMKPPRRLKIPSRLSDSTARIRAYSSHPLLESRSDRFRFLGVETLLYGVHVLESARLMMGGQPRRS